jgi:hypothetical protein
MAAWQDPPFLEELALRSVGMLIGFIPNIKRGVMKVDTFDETLFLQHEFAKKLLPFLSKVLVAWKYTVEIGQFGA